MGENTAISWASHTFNAWWGCHKISPGCKHCYAAEIDAWLHRGENWGDKAPRRFFGDAHWNKPLRWAKEAETAGVRRRVFCSSMADVFEDRDDLEVHRDRLWDLIDKTPQLDWLLLTKRPENVATMIPWLDLAEEGDEPDNVWLGVTAEDQEHADKRIPLLKRLAYLFRRTFVSYEPALGAIDWTEHITPTSAPDWVIFGDESGRERRPAELAWARATRDACERAGVAFHMKQWNGPLVDGLVGERDKKGKIHLPILDGERHPGFPS